MEPSLPWFPAALVSSVIRGRLWEVGKAHAAILRHIQERSIDLLVLGIRKTAHLGLEMRTSGAFQLIVDATCPVMTITA